MPGTPGTRTGLATVLTTDASTAERNTINAIIAWLEANAMLTSAGLLSSRPVSTPSTPGISGRRYYATDTGVEYRDTGTGWIALGVELVTSLPTSPYEGQIVDFLADATNGVVWRLRYRAASSSSFKWEVVGGSSPIVAEATPGVNTGSSSYITLASAPTITVPLNGDYEIEHGAQIYNDTANQLAMQTVRFNPLTGYVAGDGESVVHTSATANAQGTVAKKMRRTCAAASTVNPQHRTGGGGTIYVVREWVSIRPIRVGP